MRSLMAAVLILASFLASAHAVKAEFSCDASTSEPANTATPEPMSFNSITFPEGGGDLTVFAATSLTDAYARMADELEATHPNLHITIETAGSQTLVTQLEEGARADVLATASTSTMDRAQASGLINGEPILFTSNRLVIVTPMNNPAGIESIDDLATEGTRLVLANQDVPAGSYAADAFCAYANLRESPGEFLEQVESNLVSEEPDVRSVLAKVQLGEADAGVVYASDVTASQLAGVEVHVIELPDSLPTRADYPIAMVADGNTELAMAFISYVLSNEGQAILQSFGFE